MESLPEDHKIFEYLMGEVDAGRLTQQEAEEDFNTIVKGE